MIEINHDALAAHFKIDDEPTQGKIESYFKEYNALDGRSNDRRVSVPENSGNIVRAALKAQLLEPALDVSASRPALVAWLAKEINKVVAEALTIPPL